MTIVTSLIRGAERHSSLVDIVSYMIRRWDPDNLISNYKGHDSHVNEHRWSRPLAIRCPRDPCYFSRQEAPTPRHPRGVRRPRIRFAGALWGMGCGEKDLAAPPDRVEGGESFPRP